MSCNQNCNQGRSCTCDKFPQIEMLDEPVITFDKVVTYVINGPAGVGIVAIIIAIGFWSAA